MLVAHLCACLERRKRTKGMGTVGGAPERPAQRGWWWDPGEEAGVFPGKRGSLEGWSAEPRRRGLCVHTFVHVCSRVWMCVRADTRPLVTSVLGNITKPHEETGLYPFVIREAEKDIFL